MNTHYRMWSARNPLLCPVCQITIRRRSVVC